MLYEYLFQGYNAAFYLLLGVRCHECEAHQRVLRGAGGRYYGIDEHARVESQFRYEESLVDVAHVERYDGALVLDALKIYVRHVWRM